MSTIFRTSSMFASINCLATSSPEKPFYNLLFSLVGYPFPNKMTATLFRPVFMGNLWPCLLCVARPMEVELPQWIICIFKDAFLFVSNNRLLYPRVDSDIRSPRRHDRNFLATDRDCSRAEGDDCHASMNGNAIERHNRGRKGGLLRQHSHYVSS